MQSLARVVSAPLFLLGVVLGVSLTVIVVAAVSVGSWSELALQRLGYRSADSMLPGILGIVIYLGLGILGVAVVGTLLLGWSGALLGPVLSTALIAIIDRW